MAVCYIVGASPSFTPFTPKTEDFIIAADGGQDALLKMGLFPHLVVGDFDSSGEPRGVPVLKHPVEKDDTDTSLALAEGKRRGFRTFALYGCTGGRPDHTLAALQTALGGAKEGCRVFIVGEGMVGTVLFNESFTFMPKGTVSVLSLSERALGVTIEGLKYPLKDATLTSDFPLGVSNEAKEGTATVSVKAGALYLLWEGNSLPL